MRCRCLAGVRTQDSTSSANASRLFSSECTPSTPPRPAKASRQVPLQSDSGPPFPSPRAPAATTSHQLLLTFASLASAFGARTVALHPSDVTTP